MTMIQIEESNNDELNTGSNKNKLSFKKTLIILIVIATLLAGGVFAAFSFIKLNLNFAPAVERQQYQNSRNYINAPDKIGRFIEEPVTLEPTKEEPSIEESDIEELDIEETGYTEQEIPEQQVINEELLNKRLLSSVQNYQERTNTTTSPVASRQAKLLDNIDYTLVKGTKIPCVMENNIISEQSGFTSCIISQDVYSGNARVLMIEKGTRVTGEYRGDVRSGDRRLQIIWDRLITPFDIVIQLDSPTTDRLGASGTTGMVDNRWGTRIGSALLVSLMSDALEILGDRNDSAEVIVDSSTSDTSQDIARRILEKNIDLSPIIYIKDGEIINIYVADDIDLSDIYQARRH